MLIKRDDEAAASGPVWRKETMDAMTTSSLSSARPVPPVLAAWDSRRSFRSGVAAREPAYRCRTCLPRKRLDSCVRDEREAGVGERQAERVG